MLFFKGVEAQVDSMFSVARDYAFNGKRQQARALCDQILELSPEYHDVRILKGRTYSWDGLRDSARTEFYRVLAMDSGNTDAWSSLADVSYWDDQTQEALNFCDHGLRFEPNNKDLLLKRTKMLIALNQLDDAEKQLIAIRQADSACAECSALADKIYEARAVSHISFGVSADYFKGLDRLFLYQFVQFGHKSPKNTIILRLNTSQRYGDNGVQPEIDMYPAIAPKTYLYVNYGISGYSLFPRHRIGLELYRNLPRSYEVSAGGRYMDFGGGSTVWIFTGSITKYVGNYAIILRPFITPDKSTSSFSRSAILNVRRYTLDADNYVGITVGAGFSPEYVALTNANTGNEPNKVSLLEAYRIGMVYSLTIKFKHLIMIDADYRYQQLRIGSSADFYHTYSAGVSYRFRF